jgi:hypothetical protein
MYNQIWNNRAGKNYRSLPSVTFVVFLGFLVHSLPICDPLWPSYSFAVSQPATTHGVLTLLLINHQLGSFERGGSLVQSEGFAELMVIVGILCIAKNQ